MDEVVKSIMIGSILGDGFLDKPTRNGSRLTIKYDDKSITYLKWLHKKLANFGVSEIKKKRGYHQHYFSTKPSFETAYLRNVFYPSGKKIIPFDIQKILNNPISLAVWYMDDGSLDYRLKYHRNASIATFCFSYKDCELLAKTLKVNFGVEARVHLSTMRGKKYYRLYITSKSFNDFMKLIKPYINPCMRYKTL